jgi:hypothetical protein
MTEIEVALFTEIEVALFPLLLCTGRLPMAKEYVINRYFYGP